MRLVPLLVVVSGLLAAPGARALDAHAQHWSVLTATGRLQEPRLRWYAEVQPRVDFRPYMDRLLVRPAIGWEFTEGASAWAGVGWTPTFTPVFAHEVRPFLQLLVEGAAFGVTLLHRTRWEVRLVDGFGGPSQRVRHLSKAVLPLPGLPLRLAAYDEVFFNVHHVDPGPRMGLDRNRLWAGVNVPLGALLVEAGYIFEYVWQPLAAQDRVNHVAMLGVAWTAG